MLYIMAELHGNARAYFRMKDKIEFDNHDILYILGDILGGNSKNPKECLNILDDVMRNDNITLVLGDIEYVFIMYSLEHKYTEKERQKKYIQGFDGGDAFLQHMDKISARDKKKYVDYLIGCEVAEIVSVGKRYFYLVHAAPSMCKKENEILWQSQVVKNEIVMGKDYWEEVLSDPKMSEAKKREWDNFIVICGHVPAWHLAKEDVAEYDNYLKSGKNGYQKIYQKGKNINIHCGCQRDEYSATLTPTLACLGGDENGCTVTYEYNLFS